MSRELLYPDRDQKVHRGAGSVEGVSTYRLDQDPCPWWTVRHPSSAPSSFWTPVDLKAPGDPSEPPITGRDHPSRPLVHVCTQAPSTSKGLDRHLPPVEDHTRIRPVHVFHGTRGIGRSGGGVEVVQSEDTDGPVLRMVETCHSLRRHTSDPPVTRSTQGRGGLRRSDGKSTWTQYTVRPVVTTPNSDTSRRYLPRGTRSLQTERSGWPESSPPLSGYTGPVTGQSLGHRAVSVRTGVGRGKWEIRSPERSQHPVHQRLRVGRHTFVVLCPTCVHYTKTGSP